MSDKNTNDDLEGRLEKYKHMEQPWTLPEIIKCRPKLQVTGMNYREV
jgi:hypothetical protein